MSEARYLVGDVFDRMAKLPDGSVDLIVTSPPFLALRSYLPADHPDKALEIGSEATPAAFLSTLLALTREWRRVLAPHGSICVELGDTYSGSGGAGGDYNQGGLRDGQPAFDGSAVRDRRRGTDDHLERRDDDATAVGSRRSNARFRAGYLKNDGRKTAQVDDYDVSYQSSKAGGAGWPLAKSLCLLPTLYPASLAYGRNLLDPADVRIPSNPAGAPPLDCWTIPTQPYTGSHYATFPQELPRRLINLMCPREVCTTCGEPRRRIVGEVEYVNSKTGKPTTTLHFRDGDHVDGQGNTVNTDGLGDRAVTRIAPTLGWTDCGCGASFRRGHVLDPFAGSGTTLAVATGLGRDATGIDLDERNLDLARQRIGMFLTEEATT